MKTIIVSGSVCTGKTTLAKLIAKHLDFKYIDVNEVIKEKNLCERYDKERKCNVIDEKKLAKVLIEIIKKSKKNLIIDSHMSHFIPANYVDLCIITKCSLKTLKARLQERGYSENKVRENLEAEIFDTCLIEAEEMKHNILIIDTTEGIPENLINQIQQRLK